MRIISDIHGNYERYLHIAGLAEYSVQLGDLGFTYCYNRLMDNSNFRVDRHKFFRGNHDDYMYDRLVCIDDGQSERRAKFRQFNLGEYGMREHGGVNFWFTRGAFSIDRKYRTEGIDYHFCEEIEASHHANIIEEYVAAKPDVVITHECPESIGHGSIKKDFMLKQFGFNPATFNTKTGILFQKMFEMHQPKFWYMGHYHEDWESKINGTNFRCIKELGFVDI